MKRLVESDTTIEVDENKTMDEYSEDVKEAFRNYIGVDEDDSSHDDEIAEYSKNEVFDILCDYQGLIGYGDYIRDWVFDIYDVYLEDL